MEQLFTSTPFTEHWIAWLMLGLLVMIGIVNIFQPGLYARSFLSLPTTKERDSIFANSGSDFRGNIALNSLSVLTLAMTMLCMLNGGKGFHFLTYAKIAGVCAIFLLLRKGMQVVVTYTFFDRHECDTVHRHYKYLNNCSIVMLIPVLIMWLYSSLSVTVITALLIAVAAIYMVVLVYKLIACLPTTPAGLFFLPIYVMTVEVLPIVGMIFVANWLIKLS